MSRSGRVTWGQVGCLLALGAFFSVAHWTRLNSLWGDPARWLFEAGRAAGGEAPYRDFMWQFPPLSVWLMSGVFRLFGATFETAQLALDVLGAISVMLIWQLARRVLAPRLAWPTTAALTLALGTGIGPDMTWFSLQLYTPAQLTGLIGLLLVLIVVIDDVQLHPMSPRRWIALSLGSTIGLLSKPEFALGIVAALATGMIINRQVRFYHQPIDRWRRQGLLWLAAGLGPAALVYVVTGLIVGFDRLVAGVTGYGAAKYICPWWPTGFSLFGVLAALGMGAAYVAGISALRFNKLPLQGGRRYLTLWLGAAWGVIGAVIYLPALLRQNGYSAITFEDLARLATDTGVLLLPVLWWTLTLGVRDVSRWWAALRRQTPVSTELSVSLVLAAVVLALALRGLFGDQNAITPLVAMAAVPLLFVVGMRWLPASLRFFETAQADRDVQTWERVLLIGLAVFGAARLAVWAAFDLDRAYHPLVTEAGTVQVADAASAPVYEFLRARLSPDEALLDVAYGGGVNFALRRSSPVFSTQWWFMAPPPWTLEEDAARFGAQPPRYVIGNTLPYFGASYGSITPTACTFPRLVWRPDELGYDPAQTFPVLDEIIARYRPAVEIAGTVVLERWR